MVDKVNENIENFTDLSDIEATDVTPELFAHAHNKMISHAVGGPNADAQKFVNAYKVVKDLYAKLPPGHKEKEALQANTQIPYINPDMVQSFIQIADSSDGSDGSIKTALDNQILKQQQLLTEIQTAYDAQMRKAIDYCVGQGLIDIEKDTNTGKITIVKAKEPTQQQGEEIAHMFGDLHTKYNGLTAAAKKSLPDGQEAGLQKMNAFKLVDVVTEVNRVSSHQDIAKEQIQERTKDFVQRYGLMMDGMAGYGINEGFMVAEKGKGLKKVKEPSELQKQGLMDQFGKIKSSYDLLTDREKQSLPTSINSLMASTVDKDNIADKVVLGVNAFKELQTTAVQRGSEKTTREQFSGGKKEIATQILKVAGIKDQGTIDKIFTEPKYEKQRAALLKRVDDAIRFKGLRQKAIHQGIEPSSDLNCGIGVFDPKTGQLKVNDDMLKRKSTKLKEEIDISGRELAAQASMYSKWTKRDDVRGHDQDDRTFKKNVMQFDKQGKTSKETNILGALEREDDLDKSKYMTGAKDIGKSIASAPLRAMQGGRDGLLNAMAKPANFISNKWSEHSILTGKGIRNRLLISAVVVGLLVSSVMTGGLAGIAAPILIGLVASKVARAYKTHKDNQIEQHFEKRGKDDVDIKEIQEAIAKEKTVEKSRSQERSEERDRSEDRSQERSGERDRSQSENRGSSQQETRRQQSSTSSERIRNDSQSQQQASTQNKTPEGRDLIQGDKSILTKTVPNYNQAGEKIIAATKEARVAKDELDQQKNTGQLNSREHAAATRAVDDTVKAKVQEQTKVVDKYEKFENILKEGRDTIEGLKEARGSLKSVDAEDLMLASRKKAVKNMAAKDDFAAQTKKYKGI